MVGFFREGLANFVMTLPLHILAALKFDFVKAEKCPCLVHFVSSSDACDRWADKNQKYWPDYFINLLPGLLFLCGVLKFSKAIFDKRNQLDCILVKALPESTGRWHLDTH